MSCRFSRELLALHVEGDLPDAAAATTVRHLASCDECRRFLEELEASQAILKSGRRETVPLSDCAAMRRAVMTVINERPGTLGWRLRIERALAHSLRPSYGMAAVLLLGVLSLSVFAQMRPVTDRNDVAALDLPRPEAYRQWIVASGSAAADADGGGPGSSERVYINPSSYREYAQTGTFPDGTVLVWEAAPGRTVARGGAHATSATLLVSLKDSRRFEGGWGFFDFSGTGEGSPPKARALPESGGCASCHRQSSKNDPVLFPRPVSLHVGGIRAILTA